MVIGDKICYNDPYIINNVAYAILATSLTTCQMIEVIKYYFLIKEYFGCLVVCYRGDPERAL